MSVVNQMLNDLESRENNQPKTHASYQPSSTSSNKGLWAAVCLLIIGISVLAYLYFFTEKQEFSLPQNVAPLLSEPSKRDTMESGEIIEPEKASESSMVIGEDTKVYSVSTVDEPVGKKAGKSRINVHAAIDEESENSVSVSVNTPQQLSPKPELVQKAPEIESQPIDEKKVEVTSFSVKSSSSQPKKPRYQVLVADALAAGDNSRATSLLQQWVSSEPENLVPRKKLAALYFASGNFNQSEQQLLQAQRLAPEDASVRLMLARLYQQQNKPDLSWKAMQFDSTDLELLHFRAAFAREHKKMQEAQDDYRRITQQVKSDLKAWLGLAVVSEELKQNEEASYAYKQVEALAWGNTEIRSYARSRLQALANQLGESQ